MLIDAKVTNKILSFVLDANGEKPIIVCHNSDYELQLQFDDEWSGINAKTARFLWVSDGDVKKVDAPFTGNKVVVPEVARTKELIIGVYAAGIRTTTPGTHACKPSILCEDGVVPDPEPDVYAQLMTLLNDGPAWAAISLPAVSTEDNGKLLQVVNGAWAAVTIPNAEEVSV